MWFQLDDQNFYNLALYRRIQIPPEGDTASNVFLYLPDGREERMELPYANVDQAKREEILNRLRLTLVRMAHPLVHLDAWTAAMTPPIFPGPERTPPVFDDPNYLYVQDAGQKEPQSQ